MVTRKYERKNMYRINNPTFLFPLLASLLLSGCITSFDRINDNNTENIQSAEINAQTNEVAGMNYLSGYFSLFANTKLTNQEYSFIDLDQGEYGFADSINGDIEFIVSGGTSIFSILLPVNGASAYETNKRNIDNKDCINTRTNLHSTSIPDYSSGDLCILTNQNRIVILEHVETHQGINGWYYVIFKFKLHNVSE